LISRKLATCLIGAANFAETRNAHQDAACRLGLCQANAGTGRKSDKYCPEMSTQPKKLKPPKSKLFLSVPTDETSAASRRLLSGTFDHSQSPYPFADQVLDRQKRKHESIRGSEARITRQAGASAYSGIVPLNVLKWATKAFESSIEGDFWVVLDFEMRDVIDARAQPGIVELEVLGKAEDWYPDMWVRRIGRKDLLVECKPAAMVHPDPEKYPADALYMKARIAAMEASAQRHGMEFELFTELEIRVEPRFYNAKAMRRALSSHIPADAIAEVERKLIELPSVMTVLEFSRHLGPYAGTALNIACILDRMEAIALDRGAFFLPETSFRNLRGVEK
jgi:hypothetical protein